MASIAGMRGTEDWGTDERPKNFREMILWRNPNGSAPLTALMSKMKKGSTNDPSFSWWEEELNPIRLNNTATITTTTITTMVVDAGGLDLVAGDLLMVEKAAVTTYSYEIVQVASVTSATQFNVTRAAAGTTAAAMPADAKLLKIGSAFEEGSASPDSTNRNPTKETNFTQIFKTSYRMTNTAKATYIRTGDPLKNDKKRRMFDHSAAMEQAFLFGRPSETTGTAGKPLRYTGGLMYYLGKNYTAVTKPTIATISTATTTGEDDLLDAVYQVFDYNTDGSGDERVVLCGNGFLNYVNKWARESASTRINFDKIIEFYGMKLQRWIFPQGTIYLKTHPLMNVNSRYTNGAFIIDPAGIRYRPLTGRDTKPEDNIQTPGADEHKGQWLTEVGVEFNHLRSMRYLAVE